ncbi:MAG: sugar phosphate nucleotidyltransferase [Defluviitaleaceae bacterium]|nr:sugar phosphate nucleotidyltransferase [Defluviitaleaceae bacterium]
MKPALIILAAGLGSRYGGGGKKQVEKVGANGEIIAHFSVFDAIQAGFGKAVFVIKSEMREYFDEHIAKNIQGIEVVYAYQEMDDLPDGYICPPERTKPWGTAHALWAARNVVDTPFMSINADDFYGAQTYRDIFNHIAVNKGDFDYAMPGFLLKNTVPERGEVTRGVCMVKNGMLTDIVETEGISRAEDGNFYHENNILAADTPVSMNCWGFKPNIFAEITREFCHFLDNNIADLKSEFYLPNMVQTLVGKGICNVHVSPARDKWYGITNPEDADKVRAAIAQMIAAGQYPPKLF